jgi:hypothetical protein
MVQRENQLTVLSGEAQPDQQSKEDTDTGSKSGSFEIKKSDNSTLGMPEADAYENKKSIGCPHRD